MSKLKIDSLNPEIADLVGVNPALIYQKIVYYSDYHESNKTNFYDGQYWVYYSIEALAKQFEYFTPRQIRTALKKLLDAGLIISGNYNKFKSDRTLWYSVNKAHVTQKSNANDAKVKSACDTEVKSTCDTEVKPLPIQSHIDTNIYDPPNGFEKFYSAMPKTKYATRNKAVLAFMALSHAEQEQAIGAAIVYQVEVKANNPSFVHSPQRFLTERVFSLPEYHPTKLAPVAEIPDTKHPSRKLYDALDKEGKASSWSSWFTNNAVNIDGTVIKPKSPFYAYRLKNDFGSIIHKAGFKIEETVDE